ncbi:unnamed protein product [Leptidea sinapis]|uniref:Uncharacterized protein n=1 Tax=Leptidea sinapis TaxID=189913 RepID=A0A5E4QS20_9NEOP|nr:unnamed protein product [Leptidea sinapis]
MKTMWLVSQPNSVILEVKVENNAIGQQLLERKSAPKPITLVFESAQLRGRGDGSISGIPLILTVYQEDASTFESSSGCRRIC